MPKTEIEYGDRKNEERLIIHVVPEYHLSQIPDPNQWKRFDDRIHKEVQYRIQSLLLGVSLFFNFTQMYCKGSDGPLDRRNAERRTYVTGYSVLRRN
jgi:hypothetical protein